MTETKARAIESCAYWLAPHAWLTLFSYPPQDHFPRDSTIYSETLPSISNINQQNASWLWSQAIGGSFFTDISSPRWFLFYLFFIFVKLTKPIIHTKECDHLLLTFSLIFSLQLSVLWEKLLLIILWLDFGSIKPSSCNMFTRIS